MWNTAPKGLTATPRRGAATASFMLSTLAAGMLAMQAAAGGAFRADLRTATVLCCDTNSTNCVAAAKELGKHLALIAGARRRPAVFVQAQLKYGAQRDDFLHRWYERPLHQDSSLVDADNGQDVYLNLPAWRRTVEALRLGKMDGIAFFACQNDWRMTVLERSLLPGGETGILFELSHAKGFEGRRLPCRTTIASTEK